MSPQIDWKVAPKRRHPDDRRVEVVSSDDIVTRWQTLANMTRLELEMITRDAVHPWNAREARRLLAKLAQYERLANDPHRPFAEAGAEHGLAHWGPNGHWPYIEMMARSYDPAAQADQVLAVAGGC
jgi:hypothetical protein